MKKLEHRVAVITGAGQGIGAAIAREFAREGAIVAAVDLNPETVEELCAELVHEGSVAQAGVFDITHHELYRRFVEDVCGAYGKIDVLVNNAAICSYADILHDNLDQWRRTQAVDLEAVYWGSKLVAPIMAAQQWGRIINISSVQAFATEGKVGAYCAAKGGITSFTKSLAVELAPYGILANAIAPGCIHTPMSIINGVDETTTELFQTWYIAHRKIPLARVGRPEEIARAALFLASEDCSYITGHTLVVDGGLSITF